MHPHHRPPSLPECSYAHARSCSRICRKHAHSLPQTMPHSSNNARRKTQLFSSIKSFSEFCHPERSICFSFIPDAISLSKGMQRIVLSLQLPPTYSRLFHSNHTNSGNPNTLNRQSPNGKFDFATLR